MAAPAAATELNFEILVSAVTLAKEHQVRTVAMLRSMLARRFPGRDTEVDGALRHWAEYEVRSARRSAAG